MNDINVDTATDVSVISLAVLRSQSTLHSVKPKPVPPPAHSFYEQKTTRHCLLWGHFRLLDSLVSYPYSRSSSSAFFWSRYATSWKHQAVTIRSSLGLEINSLGILKLRYVDTSKSPRMAFLPMTVSPRPTRNHMGE